MQEGMNVLNETVQEQEGGGEALRNFRESADRRLEIAEKNIEMMPRTIEISPQQVRHTTLLHSLWFPPHC